ncbi:MAG: glycosyltransferase family 9 protein [Alistipes sp.]
MLVIRMSAMGDVAMLPHALRALKDAYPTLKITVATKLIFKPFFEGLGVEIMPVDPQETHHSIKGMYKLACEVRKMGIDGVADVHDVLRSKIFRLALCLRGVKMAHIDKGHFEKWMRLKSGETCAVPLKHTVIRYCDTFRKLGYQFDDPTPATKPLRPNPMGEKTGTWIGFAPFSAQTGKTYPIAQSREAMRLLCERYDRVFIHSGGGDEGAFAQEMERLYPNATALYGKVKLDGEIDLISHLDCVVSMDSLVMHLAALVATPVVSVWGATHPSLGFLGYGCGEAGVLQIDMPCRPCSVYGKQACKYGDYRCLREITPQMIADRVSQVLAVREPIQN